VFSDKFGPGLTTAEIVAVEFVAQIEETVVIVKMEEDKDNLIHLIGEKMNCLVRPPNENISMVGKKWINDEVCLAQKSICIALYFFSRC
jgi:hypothetical protein